MSLYEPADIPTGDLRWLILRDLLDQVENDDTPSSVMVGLEQAGVMLRQLLQEVVDLARTRGYTWQQIGQCLGMTKQGAWLRFAGTGPAAGQDG